ncbi:MAG TPA: SWIB/MDM2 domain-containing protein [Thermoanaerobaculia bacterium]|jgi:chromatin remodeling complex protein RSC6|nr:SWIB/MDM2 domain-containing protein [Thermoanaerobaculia bacterium]
MATKRRKTAGRKSAKKRAKRPAARKKTAKRAKRKSTTKRKPNPAFMRPLQPSSTLANVIGSSPMPRTQVISKLWAYIKRNGLQDSKNRRAINADEKLRPLFGGRSQVTMFDLAKIANKNLS